TLRLGDRTIQAGDEIDPADIGNLVFDAGDNFNGSSFTYTAIDNLGAESEPGTITLNSPPTATGGSETIPPGSATNLSDSLLSANDPDGNVDFFKITGLPPTNQGRLFIGDPERGGREVRENERLTPGQLDQLFFQAEPGFTGTNFEFIAIDNDGGRSQPAEVTLDQGNSPPDTNDALQVIEPGAPVTLEGLGGTDIEDDDDTLEFEIEELPGEGTLTLNGNPVSVGQRLTAQELSQLQFEFPEGFSGNTSFTYAAIDSDGLKDPTPGTVFLKTEGSNIPPDTNEVTQNVPPNTFGGVNEIPAGVATRLTGLGGNDPDGDVREFRITQAPSNGTLFLGDPGDGGRALGTGDRIPKDRINDVFFLPGNNFNGTNFRYAAVDNEGEEDPTPAQVTLDVGNRFPDTDNVTNPLPDPGQIIRLSGLGGSDADGQVIGFVINTLPNRGRLFLGHPEAGGVPIEEGQILTVSEIGRLFLDVGDGTGDIRFTYSAIDNLGAIDPIPGEVLFTDRTTAPGDEEDDEDDDPVSEIGVDPSPTPIGTPSPSPSPEPEPEEDFESLCPPKPEKPEIPDLPELPDITRQMPELPVLEVDGLEQLNSRETSENTSGDTVVGGAEDNDIRGSAGDDQLRGGDGDDLIVTGGGNNVLAGNAGDDTILGHVGADTIYGGRDNDLILGRGGNNVIWGDRGNDTISGGPGDDIIGGGPQNRTPDFEGSDDLIYGDAGNDTIFGNLGQNSLSGGDGDDLIFGGQGDDLIFGDAGNDTLKGESGNDTLIGSPDTIEAARDDDTLPAQEDMLPDEGELNLEELTFEALAGLEDPRRAASEETDSDATDPEPDPEATTPGESEPEADDRTPTPDPVNPERPLTFEELAELDDPRSTASEETDSDETQPDSGPDSEATPPEDGSDADSEDSQVTPEPDPQPDPDPDADPISEGDLLSGNQGDDVLFGGAGNDTLFGGNDDDWLDGGSGDDLLFGDRGSDTLYGNQGNNT
ncbi:MAG: hypothetical protein JJU32_20420, partial [Phormidium sp. BM_Day4_Bin.17]|nr:hypothetical protein [Phormidium sp. BM_Day4_Bin.17]